MNRGVLYAIAAALLFGLSTPLAKLAVDSTQPLLVAGILYLGSGIGLAIARRVRAATVSASREASVTRADLPWLIGAIVTGGIIAPALLLFGLFNTSASTGSLLLNLEAVATAVIAWVVFRENVDRRVAAGFVCILLGGVILALPSRGEVALSQGALLVAAACVCWGIDNNLTRRISGSDPWEISMWKGLAAGTTNAGFALACGAKLPSVHILLAVATIGFLGYGISLVLFVLALRHLGTARTGAYFSTAPFAGAAFALAIGQGRLDWTFVVSGVLMGLGVLLHVTEKHAHEHTHEEMEHEHLHVHDVHHQHEHLPDDPAGEPHVHRHRHQKMTHNHPHYPDLHHQHH